jgi:hypothetical protein
VGDRSHEAVSRRPPNSLNTIAARTHMYTYAAKVWALPIIQGPFSVAPCRTLSVTIRNCFIAVLHSASQCVHPAPNADPNLNSGRQAVRVRVPLRRGQHARCGAGAHVLRGADAAHGLRAAAAAVPALPQVGWVMLRARWVTLRACWVTLRARWVTLKAG